jgi:hypothetical protein
VSHQLNEQQESMSLQVWNSTIRFATSAQKLQPILQ